MIKLMFGVNVTQMVGVAYAEVIHLQELKPSLFIFLEMSLVEAGLL